MWLLSIVINSFRLALLLSATAIYLMGLGWLGFRLVLHKNETRSWSLLQVIPLLLAGGLILNLGLVLLLQRINIALPAGCLLSVIGIYFFVRDLRSVRSRPVFSYGSIYPWLGAAVVCLLLLGPILANPLKDWDARSIWFFHAKMIYSAGTMGQAAGWQDPSVVFSHPDYPVLIPVLAAQIATVTGFWNEFIPKVSLLFLLLPPVLWLFSFARKSISFLVLILLIPFTFYRWMWNGYMDGYLALYFAASLLLLGRYIKSSDIIDLISGLCCLAILLYLKNEGALAALAGIASILLILLLQRKIRSFKNPSTIDRRYYLAGLLVVLPFLLWAGYKWQWDISNDLELGTLQSISRIGDRVADGSYRLVFQNIFQETKAGLLVLALLWFAASWRNIFPRESIPALIAAVVYCLGLAAIYLLTPYRVDWQVRTSMERTMLSVNAGIFVACYFFLSALERKKTPDW
jgi:hypothetical protein